MKIATPARVVRLLRDRLAATGDAGRTVTLGALVGEILPYPLARSALDLAGKAEYDLALLRLLENRTYLQVDPAVVDAVSEELERPEPGLEFVDELADSLLRLRRIDLGPLAQEELAEEEEEEPETSPGEAIPVAGDTDEDPGASPAPEAADAMRARSPGPVPESVASHEGRPSGSAPSPRPAVRTPRRGPGPPLDLPEEAPSDVAVPPAGTPEPDVRVPGREAGAPARETAAPTRCWSCGGRLPAREAVLYCPRCGTGQRDRRCSACGDRVEPDWRFCVRCGRGLPQP